MAIVSPQPDNIAEQEMLSAYLDNQLSAAERAVLERRLQTDGRLQAELRELQAVKTALNELPSVAPPRSFTLDPATARGPMRLPLFQLLRLGSALAAMLLVLTFTLDFVRTPASSAPMAAEAPAAGFDTASGGAAANEPTSAPFMSAARKQPTAFSPAQAQDTGASQSEPSALQQDSDTTAAAASAPTAAESLPAATSAPAAAAEGVPAATSAPASAAAAEGAPAATAAPAAMSAPAAASAPTALPEVVQPGPLHASGSSSPGTDESALPVPQQRSGVERAPTSTPFRWLQLALGVIAVALALGAWLVRRRERT